LSGTLRGVLITARLPFSIHRCSEIGDRLSNKKPTRSLRRASVRPRSETRAHHRANLKS
jgi:hypothetical protein